MIRINICVFLCFYLVFVSSCSLLEKEDEIITNAENIESLYLEIYKSEGAVRKFTAKDRTAISSFVNVMNKGISRPVHKCTSWGYITVKEINGKVTTVYIRPGHGESFYIFRILEKGEYKVSRAEFLKFLKTAGVTEKYFIVP